MTSAESAARLSATDIEPQHLVGYSLDAIDRHIGKVDKATAHIHADYLIVDVGLSIFGQKRMLPLDVINDIDPALKTVHVNPTRAQVKDGPALDGDDYHDRNYLKRVDAYFGVGGLGSQDW